MSNYSFNSVITSALPELGQSLQTHAGQPNIVKIHMTFLKLLF